MIHKFTINRKVYGAGGGGYVVAKEGCCGSSVKILLSEFTTTPNLGDILHGRSRLVLGLTKYEVLIEGKWIKV